MPPASRPACASRSIGGRRRHEPGRVGKPRRGYNGGRIGKNPAVCYPTGFDRQHEDDITRGDGGRARRSAALDQPEGVFPVLHGPVEEGQDDEGGKADDQDTEHGRLPWAGLTGFICDYPHHTPGERPIAIPHELVAGRAFRPRPAAAPAFIGTTSYPYCLFQAPIPPRYTQGCRGDAAGW